MKSKSEEEQRGMRVYLNGQETCKVVTTSGHIIDQTSIGPYQAFIRGNNISMNLFNGLINDSAYFPCRLRSNSISSRLLC